MLSDHARKMLEEEQAAAEAERKARRERLFARVSEATLARLGGKPGDLVSPVLQAKIREQDGAMAEAEQRAKQESE